MYRESIEIQLKSIDQAISFVKPGMQQLGGLLQFYVEALRDTVLTKEEQARLKEDEILDKCLTTLKVLQATKTQEELAQILGLAMTKPSAITYVQNCLQECFPGLAIAQLRDDVFIELITRVQSELL